MYLNQNCIYANPYKYAYRCNVPIELARIICKYQNHIAKLTYHAKKCPRCGARSLYFEGGSYEEGYGDFIECETCEETFGVDDIENGEYLSGWSDFDVILYGSLGDTEEERRESRIAMCGSDDIKKWHEFAWRHINQNVI